jgi:hypothetical protein
MAFRTIPYARAGAAGLAVALAAMLFGGATKDAEAQPAEAPKVEAAAKREKLTLKDVKIEGGALIVTGSTGLPSRRVTILNAPEPRIAVTSDRKGNFTIRRTDFRPDDCRLQIGLVSGVQTALVANCGPKGTAGTNGAVGAQGGRRAAGHRGPGRSRGLAGCRRAGGCEGRGRKGRSDRAEGCDRIRGIELCRNRSILRNTCTYYNGLSNESGIAAI